MENEVLHAELLPSGVVHLTLDRPPVNAIGADLRQALVQRLQEIESDPLARACVITGAGAFFSAGADISEFDRAPVPPGLPDVFAIIAASRKPVVAAVNGVAFGGGLELALACHGRIATDKARLALPEIKLGLIPGAGGTQRLPRIVGLKAALAMILDGEPITAEEALETGLVGAIAEAPILIDTAVAHALSLASAGTAGSDATPVEGDDEALETAARRGARSRIGSPAARAAAIEAARAALSLPLEQGLARERALFQKLRAGPESAALRHIFRAERAASQSVGEPRPVRRVAVVGSGTMGCGIAMCFADAGFPATLIDTDAAALAAGLSRIRTNYDALVRRGTISRPEADARIARIFPAADLAAAVVDADVVVEAVFEDMEVKRAVFTAIDNAAPQGALLATNTSYLDVDAIAAFTRRPQDVAGLHFFSPAHVMKLLEVVRGRHTSDTTLAAALTLAKRLGKVSVVSGVCHGFIGNRMLARRSAQAERLLLEGALPQEVDDALTGFGFPMGPFAVTDLSGLDIGMRMRRARGLRAEIADALCDARRFGQKTGAGFYRYAAGSRQPEPDPEVERLIADRRTALDFSRRDIPVAEIVDRIVLPLIDEGAKILAEGIAARPGDIDLVWIHGYGFPPWLGGPMFYAAQRGLDAIVARLEALAIHDPSLAPGDAVRALAPARRPAAAR